MSYFGKYKDSRKAVDLVIIDDGFPNISYQWLSETNSIHNSIHHHNLPLNFNDKGSITHFWPT